MLAFEIFIFFGPQSSGKHTHNQVKNTHTRARACYAHVCMMCTCPHEVATSVLQELQSSEISSPGTIK